MEKQWWLDFNWHLDLIREQHCFITIQCFSNNPLRSGLKEDQDHCQDLKDPDTFREVKYFLCSNGSKLRDNLVKMSWRAAGSLEWPLTTNVKTWTPEGYRRKFKCHGQFEQWDLWDQFSSKYLVSWCFLCGQTIKIFLAVRDFS